MSTSTLKALAYDFVPDGFMKDVVGKEDGVISASEAMLIRTVTDHALASLVSYMKKNDIVFASGNEPVDEPQLNMDE